MATGSFLSYLKSKNIFRYGQEYFDKRQNRLKPAKKIGAVICKKCGVAHVGGRWTWETKPLFPKKTVCPACRRIDDNHPAAILRLTGEIYREHLIDISALIKHFEVVEKKEHPLSRIMDISTQGNQITIRATTPQIVESISSMIGRTFGVAFVNRNNDLGGVLTIDMNA